MEQPETGEAAPLRAIRWLILGAGAFFLLFSGVLELTWPEQIILGLLTTFLAIWMDRSSSSYLVTLTMMLVSCFSTFRYGFWRISTTVRFFLDPGSHWSYLDAFFIWLLVGAEAYAFIILYLGYIQTVWPLRRAPVPLPDDTGEWPSVDVLIPTYNEPLSVVRYTALAAANIDWPADKLNIYILDDGRREEFRRFAEEAGVGYMTRSDNAHAKAGNINRALKRLDSPFVTIFDCDHVPTRSFLQVTLGWFIRDKKLAMLQTPHHFYSPDPFERNLDQFRVIPNEGELFYGIVQDGNDFWNATFFCGSCAVLRRTALDEIGGIAVETVTEDAHTSLRMQMNGWNTAYINIPQAAGLATERLSGHVKQRIRWARGMIQILRTDNPLFAKGLKGIQRLCYFNAMSHFLYALPRLIFLTSPLIYLVFGHVNVPGYWAAILAYAFPHLVLSAMTNSRIQGKHRHSFWNEIYETVLAPYILLPTFLAMINPKLGKFDVTAKGGVVNKSFFDKRIAQPFILMLGLNFFGMLLAIPRAFEIPLPFIRLLYDQGHIGTVVMNLIWTVFNVLILGVATSVARENQQRRQTVRVDMAVPARILLPGGEVIAGTTVDMSSGGGMIRMDSSFTVVSGQLVNVVMRVLDGDATLPATIVSFTETTLRIQFDALTLLEEEALTMVLYSRADTWLGWGADRAPDRPLRSLALIFRLAVRGLGTTARALARPSRKSLAGKRRLATSIAPVLLLLVLAGTSLSAQPGVSSAFASRPRSSAAKSAAIAPPPAETASGSFNHRLSLADLGVPETIDLRGADAFRTVAFSLPQTEIVKSAKMHLRYHFSPALMPALSHLKVSLNGTLVSTLAVTAAATSEAAAQVATAQENSALLQADLDLPAEMLVHNNELTFEFVGHYTEQCEDPSHTALWSHIDNTSTIDVQGSRLALQNDLKLLPLPFYDEKVDLRPVVPVVFLSQPSGKALQAAGIITSWFGMLSNSRPFRFPVSVGNTIPAGNAIVISENAAQLPASLNLANTSGPTIAMRSNPSDGFSKVLVLTGDTPDDLLTAASALAIQRDLLQGEQVRISSLNLPAPRQPDDAPRWLDTDKIITLGDLAGTPDLQTDGSGPLNVYMRLPPDLYFGNKRNLALHLSYRYNGLPLSNESSMQVFVNGGYVSSTPLPHTDTASAELNTVVPIPVVNLRPFSNSLLTRFIFLITKKGKCQDVAPYNMQGTILKDSYLDLRGTPHWAVLPNLEIFSNAGYPFTRKADLADTAVVLPDIPTSEEMEMFVTMMGHFGAQTGYPVLNVTVTNNEGMRSDGSKDYLVMGTVDDQPALSRLSPSLPVGVDTSGLHIQDTQGFFSSVERAWWKVRSSDHVQSGQLETEGGLPDALIEGLEWPRGSKRSVVLMTVRDGSTIPNFLSTFLKSSQSSDVSQSVSVLQGPKFVSYRIGGDVYRVGSLSPWIHINILFSQFPWLVVVVAFLLCFVMAMLLRAMLRARARRRLEVTV